MIFRRSLPRATSGDRGSVTVLVIGLVPILFLIVAVGVDASVLFVHKRALVASADAAALAGAQSADLERLYRGKAQATLPLDCAAARTAVEAMITPGRVDSRSGGAIVEATQCDGSSVSVTLRSQASLPFAQHLGFGPTVTVRGRATARSPLR